MIEISDLALYNDDRNSQEVDTMFLLESNEKIGKYLRTLIEEREKLSITDFCKMFLIEKYNKVNYTDDNLNNELKTTKNTFSRILSGKQGLTLEQLSILSALLKVSCEEILSAGKHYAPTRNHVTNYDIAQSSDRKVWDEYMKREDSIFLNCDEYCKTVIDYALEFKNYAFMKYLLDEGFIWFVDPQKYGFDMYDYGAGTKIPPKEHTTKYSENYLTHEIRYQDRLRTQTIALGLECGDCDILESMRAREIPELHLVDAFGAHDIDFNKNRNDNLIDAVACSEIKDVIEYFSDEFTVQDRWKNTNTFIYPFLENVIETMLDNGKYENAMLLLRKAIEHNKSTYENMNSLIDGERKEEYNAIQAKKESIMKEAYQNGVSLADLKIEFKSEEDVRKSVLRCFNFEKNNNLVTFFVCQRKEGIATNIIKMAPKERKPEIKKLIGELNEWYNKVISLGGEEYAEVLL